MGGIAKLFGGGNMPTIEKVDPAPTTVATSSEVATGSDSNKKNQQLGFYFQLFFGTVSQFVHFFIHEFFQLNRNISPMTMGHNIQMPDILSGLAEG